MAGSDVRQLILQVDASVAVAQRNLRSLAKSVEQDSGNIEKSLGRVDNAHQKLGGTLGNTRIALLEVQHVARGAADQFAAGAPLTQILTQHLAQLGQAASFAGESFGKFGAFLGGPWGIALTLAAVVIGKLALAHDDAKGSVEGLLQKMRDQANEAVNQEKANAIWARSLDGVRESQRKLREEIEKSFTTEAAQQQAHLRIASTNLAGQRSALPAAQQAFSSAQGQFNDAQRTVDILRGSVLSEGGQHVLEAAETRLAVLRQKLDAARAALGQLRADVAASEQTVRDSQIVIAERQASYATDSTKKINDYYDNQILAAKLAAKSSDALTASLQRQIEKFNLARAAALKAAEDAKKTTNNQQFGREINLNQAKSIVAGIGGRVTSGFRTTAEQQRLYDTVRTPSNPVAVPGTSAHEKGNALDVAFGPGITVAALKKAFADEGVRLTKVLKETGHFHIEFSTSGADKATRSAERDAKSKLHGDNSFTQESDRADQELLAAQKALVVDLQERAAYAAAQVRAEQGKAKDAIAGELSEGKITAAQAKILSGKQDQIAAQKITNIETQKREQLAHESLQLAQTDSETQIGHLQALEQLAVTTTQRKELQLKIVDAQTQILINANQEIIDSTTASQAQKDIARAMIERARIAQQDAHTSIERGNQSPGAAYLQSLRDANQRMSEDVQGIQVRGLESLNSGLVDAIMGTRKLGDVFHDISKQIIADLLQIAIRRAVIEPLSNALFGGSSSGSGGGFLGSLFKIGASVLGGGGGGFSLGGGGTSGALDFSGLPGLAAGGPMIGGKPYLVGERGPEIVVPRASGVVIPNHKAFGGGSPVVVNINAQDAVLSQTVRGWIMEGMTMAADAGGDVAIARSGRMNRRIMP